VFDRYERSRIRGAHGVTLRRNEPDV